MRTKAVTVSLLFVAIAAFFAIRSCSKDEPVGIVDPRVVHSNTSTVKPVNGRVHLSKPETLQGHDTVLVAMTIEDVQKKKYHDSFTETEIRTSAAAVASRLTPDEHRDATREIQHWSLTGVRWHNALFRDLASEECWQLVNQRGVISKFGKLQSITISTETQRKVDSEPVSLLAFFVTLSDTNGDDRLTDLDSRVCIVTDGDGRNPRTITPADAHVVSASFDQEHGLIWLQVAHDTNDDGAFTGLDDVAPMMFDPLSDSEARPVINAELIKQATDLLNAD